MIEGIEEVLIGLSVSMEDCCCTLVEEIGEDRKAL